MTDDKKNNSKPQLPWWDMRFAAFASRTARLVGSPLTFLVAVMVVVVWGFTGPYTGYSGTWLNVLNMGIGILTFFMVLILQNGQTREGLAIQIKLDEIIRAVQGAENSIINLEELSQQELDEERARFAELGKEARDGAPINPSV